MSHVEIITPLQDKPFMESWYELSDESHFWFRWRMTAFISQLNDLRIPLDLNWRVLDVGCGTGVLRRQVESATTWTVDATDLDYEALKHSSVARGRTFYYDITSRADSMKEAYDAILLFDVIEHIEDPEPFVASLLFHLKPAGFMFVNVPAGNWLFSRYDQVQGHFRRYDKSSIAREFCDFPVEIRDVRYWGLANVPLVALRKIWLGVASRGKSDEEIFRDGFKPLGGMANGAFVGIMKTESSVLSNPPLGSSILAVMQKI